MTIHVIGAATDRLGAVDALPAADVEEREPGHVLGKLVALPFVAGSRWALRHPPWQTNPSATALEEPAGPGDATR